MNLGMNWDKDYYGIIFLGLHNFRGIMEIFPIHSSSDH